MKKVSIIIACYNHALFLEQAIKSALNQDYLNLEIIVANDGSTDNSLEMAKIFGDKIKVISHENQGVVFARNNAIAQSAGDYILPLDADDYLASSDVVSAMIAALENEKVDLVFGNYQCFGENNNLVSPKNLGIAELLIRCFISATSLFKRELFDKIGGYAEYMKNGHEDWEIGRAHV